MEAFVFFSPLKRNGTCASAHFRRNHFLSDMNFPTRSMASSDMRVSFTEPTEENTGWCFSSGCAALLFLYSAYQYSQQYSRCVCWRKVGAGKKKKKWKGVAGKVKWKGSSFRYRGGGGIFFPLLYELSGSRHTAWIFCYSFLLILCVLYKNKPRSRIVKQITLVNTKRNPKEKQPPETTDTTRTLMYNS